MTVAAVVLVGTRALHSLVVDRPVVVTKLTITVSRLGLQITMSSTVDCLVRLFDIDIRVDSHFPPEHTESQSIFTFSKGWAMVRKTF